MMENDHYMDMSIKADPDFSAAHLMNALFSKLHFALARSHSTTIGVSFPEVDPLRPSLGGRLRLHGNARALEAFFVPNWMAGMGDHVLVGEIACVPTSSGYRYVRRVQPKSSPERMRRRQMMRHNLSDEQVRARIPQTAAQRLSLPYMTLPSHSTGQTFRLFVEHVAACAPTKGYFNAYGLSTSATVPWF